MKIQALVGALLLSASSITLAATPAYLVQSHSSEAVLDKAGALAVWKEQLNAKTTLRLSKLYPLARYGFISQVEGGFTDNKMCVVTARVMLVPRSGKSLIFDAKKSATTFDTKSDLTQAQCQDLAKAKLGEAISAVMSSLVSN